MSCNSFASLRHLVSLSFFVYTGLIYRSFICCTLWLFLNQVCISVNVLYSIAMDESYEAWWSTDLVSIFRPLINGFTTAFAVLHLVTLTMMMAASMEATVLYSHVTIKYSWAFTVNCSGIVNIY